MKNAFLFALLVLVFGSCRTDTAPDQQITPVPEHLSLLTEDQPEWQYENLRLIPIVADEEFLESNSAVSGLKTLSEAIENHRFRISEKKPYGRFEDSGAVNSLTVQNKTEDNILLLSGDIVQGGRQDRVVGDDQVIAARSLKDIPVFCVEPHRWTYHNTTDEEAASKAENDKIFAFSGYYHVAAGDIRQTLSSSKDQQEVWDKVGKITSEHEAGSETGAYAALENSEAFTRQRDAYLNFFSGKFSDLDRMVGFVAISGNQVVGSDVFGSPDLLQRQLDHLLHSYLTDAITKGSKPQTSAEMLDYQLDKINRAIARKEGLHYKEALVHYYKEATAPN
ncbi:MAG: DUF6569 family protein [Saprospiraceae bacterium]